jgi:hypothetical protein
VKMGLGQKMQVSPRVGIPKVATEYITPQLKYKNEVRPVVPDFRGAGQDLYTTQIKLLEIPN